MTVDILDIVDEVQAEIPEVLEVTATRAVRQAATEFFTRSAAWRHEARIEVEADTSEYEVVLPADAAIDTPFQVVWLQGGNERELSPVQPHQVPYTGGDGIPAIYAMTGNKIRVYPTPESGQLVVWLKLKPTRTASVLPTEAEHWFYGIRAGAIAKLLMQPKQLWSDPNAAMPFLQQFENEITEASRAGRRAKVKQRRVVAYGGY